MTMTIAKAVISRLDLRRPAAVAWLLPLALGLGGLSACGPSQTPDTLIIAASATANEPRPALSSAMMWLLKSAGANSTDAAAYVVNPVTGQSMTISLTPRRSDGQVDYGPTRNQVLSANIAAVQRVLGGEAARGPFDLLATIAAAARVVPPPATLIVVSSGLSTAGGLDMRQVGWNADPATIAAQLKARGLLPNLAGYRLVFSGLADTSGRQPPLPLPQRSTLTAYWLAVCEAVDAASCSTDDMTRPDLPSRSVTPVPVVAVPTVSSVTGPGGQPITIVPDALLFPLNSSVLLPTADGILRPLVVRARTRHLRVSVTGYASPDGGTAAYNQALSERRAEAVGQRLRALGLPADLVAQVSGAGTGGQSPSSCIVGGQLDETICAQLRRVVITMSPPTLST